MNFKKGIITVFLMLFVITIAHAGNNNNDAERKVDTAAVIQFFSKYGYSLTDSSHFPLYAQIYKLKDIPYRYSGRSEAGLDCSGFTIKVFNKVFNHQLSGGSKDIFQNTKTIKEEHLQEGDLVFFRIKKGVISHVGIYLGNNKFAHTTTHAGVMVNDLDEPYYKKTFYKATRALGNVSEIQQ